MTITVYTKPSCVQCTATYRALDSLGLEYEVLDIETSPRALWLVRQFGYDQAPLVETPYGDHWSGFRPDEIDKLATDLNGDQTNRDKIVRKRKAEQTKRIRQLQRLKSQRARTPSLRK